MVGSWNGGFAVDFNVPFDTSMDSWTFDVQLSGNYYCLAVKKFKFANFESNQCLLYVFLIR